MHYVPGHEVAAYIVQEVKNLAYSTTIPWHVVKETEDSGSYSCQVGDILATKLVGLFDCSPPVLAECITDGVVEQTPYRILEKYDRYNQILLVKLQFAALQKHVQTCNYRYITFDNETQSHYVVFQSVDHDAIAQTDDSLMFTFAPTGFIVNPVPNDPNKCQLIYVSQLIGVEQQTSKEFVQMYLASAGSLGLLWQELKQLVANYHRTVTPVPLEATIEEMRRELYLNYYELTSSKEWKTVSRAWFDVYMKEMGPDNVCVALRSRSFSTEPCRKVAARVYEAIRKTSEWMWLIFSSDVVKEIDEGSCIVKICAQALETGIPSETLYLISCREHIDGVCDVAWRSIVHEEFPLPPDRTRLEFAVNGCIICPNGDGSTLQWLGRPPMVPKTSFNSVVGRATTFMNAALSYIIHPADYLPVLDHQTGEQIKQLPKNADNVAPLPMAMSASQFRKRKLPVTPNLVSVENIVLKMVPGEQPARPFLFLVSDNSDDRKRHKFVRRRWDSAISRSAFDLLPPELLEFVFSFLDAPTVLYLMPCVCSRFKEFLENNALWKRLYNSQWGNVAGRLAHRYCGDDDPAPFFTGAFPYWRELYWEREHIEQAWKEPERHAHGFKVAAGHTRDIRAVALMPNCHRLVTGSLDKLVRVWDAHSGSCLSTLHGTSGIVSLSVANPTHIKVGYKSGVVRMADLDKLESVWEMRLAEAMRGCSFLNDKIVTWDEDIEVWDETTQQRVHQFNGHSGYITQCAFAPTNPSLLLSASRDKTVKLWDLATGLRISTISGHTRGVNGIAMIKDDIFVSASSDKTMRVWDTRRTDVPLCVKNSSGKMKCIKYSATGKKICTGGTDGVHVWEAVKFEHLRWEQAERVGSLALDEERLAFGAAGGLIRFYDFAPHK